ncbi:MAG: tandem-95 repeat protein, partial [Candidatus Marinimicrobia bacterium]|nr:tandem-95 repeat protein [Candidatus Neomarinimicrobiota bacterium]
EETGCTDELACNFVETATEDDGSCYSENTVTCYEDVDADGYYNQTQDYTECDAVCLDLGEAWSDSEGSGVEIFGCDDPEANNYDETATENDGSCEYNTPPVAFDDAFETSEDVILTIEAPGVLGNDEDAEAGGSPDWVVDVPFYEFNATITSVVFFNDEESVDENDIVAAFVDDVCRGLASPTYFPVNGRYTVNMMIYSNLSTGETMTFKAYDSSANMVGIVDYSYDFIANENVGNDMVPNELHCTYEGEGQVLSTVLDTDVTNGNLTLSADGSFEYTPNADWFGTDSFTYTAFDGEFYSDPATVTITVTSVNDAPTIDLPESFTFDEDGSLTEDFTSYLFDIDEDILTLDVSDSEIISVVIDGFTVTLEAAENWNGTETITFIVDDSQGREIASDLVDIIVLPTNDAPTANEMFIATDEDTPVEITLSGYDIDGDDLTFTVVDAPINGTYEGGIYTPNANYFGEDTFTFVANDTELDSDPATVTITVTSVNDAPTIDLPESFTFDEDGSLTEDFTSYLFDIDEDILTLDVSDSEIISVVIDGFTVTLEAAENWNGTETITFIVDDSQGREIASDLVDIIVLPTNDAPTANEMFIATDEDTPVEITLSGYDIDGDDLTFTVVDAPINGTYEGGIYTPNANYFGEDTFTFVANDTELDSDPATVSITIAPINDVPSDFVLLTPEDNTEILITEENLDVVLEFSWEASTDQDDDELTYTFIGYGDLEMLAFGSTTETSFSVTYGELEDLMYLQGLEVITGTWSILVTDGVENVEAIAFALTIDGSAVGIDGVIAPDNFALRQNHPNPFNPVTTISYDISEVSHVVLEVYNVMGQRVNTLVNGTVNVGYHQAQWDGRDDSARQLPSGVYLYHLTVNGITVDMKKMMMIK